MPKPGPKAEPAATPSADTSRMTLTGDRLAVYNDLTQRYRLTSADTELLLQGLEALERANELAAIIKRDGPVTMDRWGVPRRSHLLDGERDFKNLGARILNQLSARFV